MNTTMQEVLNSSVLKDHTVFDALDGLNMTSKYQRYLYTALQVFDPE